MNRMIYSLICIVLLGMLFQCPSAYAETSELPYSLGRIELEDSDNNPLEYLAKGNDVVVNVEVTRNSESLSPAVLVCAIYGASENEEGNNGAIQLMRTSTKIINQVQGKIEKVCVPIKLPEEYGLYMIKTYVWDSFVETNPLSTCSSSGIWVGNGEQILMTSASSDGSNEIVVRYVEAILFGSQKVYIYYKKQDGSEQKIYTTSILNDGADIYPNENCSIQWSGNIATVTFSGNEQQDEVITVDFNSDVPIIQTR